MFTFIKTIRELQEDVERLTNDVKTIRAIINVHSSSITCLQATPTHKSTRCPKCQHEIDVMLPPFSKDQHPVVFADTRCVYCNALVHITASLSSTCARIDHSNQDESSSGLCASCCRGCVFNGAPKGRKKCSDYTGFIS